MSDPLRLATLAAHAGEPHGPNSPMSAPIVRSTIWRFTSTDELQRFRSGALKGFLYTRDENPTVRAAEGALAQLEGAEAAILFASGMGAMSCAVLGQLAAGDEVLCSSAIYGGTWKLLRDLLSRFGVQPRMVEPAQLRSACAESPRAKLCLLETPTNPGLRVLDIPSITEVCRARGIPTVLDATFATPYLLRPLELGVDVVMHSTTKYLNGHSDALGGALLGSQARIAPLRKVASELGATPSPEMAFELMRGLKTFPLRMERTCQSAMQIAQWLAARPEPASVSYPGLPSHPDHALARRQLRAFGGMITFSLGTVARACAFWDALKLIARAASLGGVESLASLPVLFSHAGYSDEELARAGIDAGMVRLSIGLEDPEDLLADLAQALAAV